MHGIFCARHAAYFAHVHLAVKSLQPPQPQTAVECCGVFCKCSVIVFLAHHAHRPFYDTVRSMAFSKERGITAIPNYLAETDELGALFFSPTTSGFSSTPIKSESWGTFFGTWSPLTATIHCVFALHYIGHVVTAEQLHTAKADAWTQSST